ncbi:MAG: TonB-dependent receptor [Acidobacteriia bacterium]|nr:TonB-dependent receptor [Terriglobia bacterium]
MVVEVAGTVRVDAALEVGSATEAITVQAEAPLLKTESGELSHNIDYNRVDEIPLLTLGTPGTLGNVRNPLQVVSLLPGAAFSGENTLRINGMPSSSQAIRIEGQDATNGFWREINQNVQAGVDAIQEVAIQTSNYAPEYGQAGGGYFNYTMRSGTNQLHGTAYDYFDNEALNAGLPFTDNGAGGHIRNTVRRNDYGFTLGGPVWLPKIYNGKDKTFFFFNFEQFRENQVVRSGIATVPTAAYRIGDFSGAQIAPLTAGRQPLVDSLGQPLIQNEVFDPNSTRTGPDGVPVRTPYPNGQIPASQMDPVALKIQSMFPLPNLSGFANNYAIPAYSNFRHTTIPSVKLDHSLSATIKLSGYWQQTHTLAPNNNGFSPSQFAWSAPEPTDTTNNTARINYDHTLKPTLLLHLGIGIFYTDQPAVPPSFNQTSLGPQFAPFYINQFPNIGSPIDSTIAPVRGGAGLPSNAGGIGNTFGVLYLKDVKPTANANLTWVKGNHTYKVGGEMIVEGFPQVNYTRANGQFGFGQNQTGDPWEFQKGGNASTGFAYASFLIGAPNSLTVSQVTDSRIGNHSLGFYAQDSWKVNRRFTLDYGLRYDYVTLLREEHGRMQSASFSTPNPLAGGRLGDVIYEATCGCRFNHNYPYAFGPRLGAAYQIDQKTVLRMGAGLSYSSAPNNACLSYSVPDFYTFTAAPGSYAGVTPLQGGNPFAPGNPYGNAPIVWPDFSPHYPVPFNGATIPSSPFIYIDPNAGRPPRILQWSIGLQRQVANNLVVEASYVGNRGVWWTAPVLADQAYNALTPQSLKQNWGLDITNANDRALLGLPINSPAVIARFAEDAGTQPQRVVGCAAGPIRNRGSVL